MFQFAHACKLKALHYYRCMSNNNSFVAPSVQVLHIERWVASNQGPHPERVSRLIENMRNLSADTEGIIVRHLNDAGKDAINRLRTEVVHPADMKKNARELGATDVDSIESHLEVEVPSLFEEREVTFKKVYLSRPSRKGYRFIELRPTNDDHEELWSESLDTVRSLQRLTDGTFTARVINPVVRLAVVHSIAPAGMAEALYESGVDELKQPLTARLKPALPLRTSNSRLS